MTILPIILSDYNAEEENAEAYRLLSIDRLLQRWARKGVVL